MTTTTTVSDFVALTPRDTLKTATEMWGPYLTKNAEFEVADSDAARAAAAAAADFEKWIALEATAYPRPNGADYLPRKMKIEGVDLHDVSFIRIAVDKRLPVLLFGDPGCGKTALVEAAIDGVITVQGTVETETADFVGSWAQQTDGTYRWVDGPLVLAMLAGKPLLIDEIALIDPRVMAVVYGVMDGRDRLDITANPERGSVEAADGFMVLGACNPNVPGAVMSDALLSRFQLHIEMTTDWGLCKRLGITAEIIHAARNLHTKQRSGEVMVAPQVRELLTFMKVAETFGQNMALRNMISQARPEDRAHYEAALKATFPDASDSFTALKL